MTHKNQYIMTHKLWQPSSSSTVFLDDLKSEEEEMIEQFQWAYYRNVTPKILDRAIDSAFCYFREEYYPDIWQHTDIWEALVEESINDKMEGIWHRSIEVESKYDFDNRHSRQPDKIMVKVVVDDREYRRYIPILYV